PSSVPGKSVCVRTGASGSASPEIGDAGGGTAWPSRFSRPWKRSDAIGYHYIGCGIEYMRSTLEKMRQPRTRVGRITGHPGAHFLPTETERTGRVPQRAPLR